MSTITTIKKGLDINLKQLGNNHVQTATTGSGSQDLQSLPCAQTSAGNDVSDWQVQSTSHDTDVVSCA